MRAKHGNVSMAIGFAAASVIGGAATPVNADGVKNVILLIADGAGFSTLEATNMWQGKTQVYDGKEWAQLAAATYSLRTSPTRPVEGPAGLVQDPNVVYSSALAWNTAPAEGGGTFPFYFEGYRWLRATDPDSANTMSAMVNGVKTFNNAINVDGNGNPIVTAPEIAKKAGKSVGSLSSVPFTHATVAAGAGAHHINRNSYHDLANEILTAGVVDVIGGGGNPNFNSSGQPIAKPSYTWVSAADWNALAAGTLPSGDGVNNWTLAQTRAEIEALATGTTPVKVAIMPQVGDTLQQSRGSSGDPRTTAPGVDPFTTTVPSLEAMTLAALNVLDNNPNGFFLHVEGGAVDWAMHANQFGRMIEEHIEFVRVVETVTDYLDANTNGNNWSNTLVVITADHDHMLFGPESDTIPFQPLVDNGAGVLPGYLWHDNSHSNMLVPLKARGASVDRIVALAEEYDYHSDGVRSFGRGHYLHQAELGQLLTELVSQPAECVSDFNGNGTVDSQDLFDFLDAFFTGCR